METTPKIRSKTAGSKQKITYSMMVSGIEYRVTLTLNADGDGEKDIKKKLLSLLENELRRQLKNN